MRIRPETTADAAAVRALNDAAFGSSHEAEIVETLRARGRGLISLVADSQGSLLGHIVFSPVRIESDVDVRLMGLGPMAVAPGHQRRGVGSALVREGLERCRAEGHAGVVVLGHPDYYPRFGFVPASRHGIDSEYDVPDEAFMVVELAPGSLAGVSGRVRYDEAFAGD